MHRIARLHVIAVVIGARQVRKGKFQRLFGKGVGKMRCAIGNHGLKRMGDDIHPSIRRHFLRRRTDEFRIEDRHIRHHFFRDQRELLAVCRIGDDCE
ncbi:hypothetical protein D3C80_1560390 [compost metagenome]